jgi:hypothetical protein
MQLLGLVYLLCPLDHGYAFLLLYCAKTRVFWRHDETTSFAGCGLYLCVL